MGKTDKRWKRACVYYISLWNLTVFTQRRSHYMDYTQFSKALRSATLPRAPPGTALLSNKRYKCLEQVAQYYCRSSNASLCIISKKYLRNWMAMVTPAQDTTISNSQCTECGLTKYVLEPLLRTPPDKRAERGYEERYLRLQTISWNA